MHEATAFQQSPNTPDGDAAAIVAFLQSIGLGVRFAQLGPGTFVPGIALENNGLVIDAERLLYPGDLLHEAGHLAVMTPERRMTCGGEVGTDMGEEIGAQCWSYAAAVHLGLDPEVVFHEHGYQGSAETLRANYAEHHVGVPLLQWMGLTLDRKRAEAAGMAAYPHMQRWLREEQAA